MKRKSITIILFFSIFFFQSHCSSIQQKSVLDPSPSYAGNDDRGDVILAKEVPVAELKYLRLQHPEATSSEKGNIYGIVLNNFESGKETWVWPSKGLIYKKDSQILTKIDDINKEWNKELRFGYLYLGDAEDHRHLDKEDIVELKCYNIRISEDGREIHFTRQGIFRDKEMVFLINSGLLKE